MSLCVPFLQSTNAVLGTSSGIVIAPEIQVALRRRQAVVALESTIVSHGMPLPQNLQTALEVEAVVRNFAWCR